METLMMSNLPEATHWYCGENSGGCGSYGLVSQLKKFKRVNCPYCDHTKLTMMGGANQMENKEEENMNEKPVLEAEVVSTSLEQVTEVVAPEEVKPIEVATVVTRKPRKVAKPVEQIVFPDGEFTAKSLVALTNQGQPIICKQINEAEANGIIKYVRDEKSPSGRGRPTRIFIKA